MLCRKTEAAFRYQCENLFEDHERIYFWTVTFSTLHSDWECAALFRRFLNHLREVVGRTGWGGVRVAELHEHHGVHYHLLVTERLAADLVRRVGRCHGVGWVKVKLCYDKAGAISYLCKYLSKEKEAPKTEPRRKVTAAVWSIGFTHKLLVVGSRFPRQRNARKWASFGDVRRTRVKDVYISSEYWDHRKRNNQPFLTYRFEALLNACWCLDPIGTTQQFDSGYFQASLSHHEGEDRQDLWALASGKLKAHGLMTYTDGSVSPCKDSHVF